MRLRFRQVLQTWLIAVGVGSLGFLSQNIAACELATAAIDASPGEIKAFFEKSISK